MEKVTSVNEFIGCLPSIPKTNHRWTVYYHGVRCGSVRASCKSAALEFIPVAKYPERENIVLEYVGKTF